MPNNIKYLFISLFIVLAFAACQAETEPESLAKPAATEAAIVPTDTPEPVPTETPEPTETATAVPTSTPEPEPTETPTAVATNTAEPEPTETAEPTRRATATPGSSTSSSESAAEDEGTSEESDASAESDDSSEETPSETTVFVEDEDVETIFMKSEEALNKIETITQDQISVMSTSFFTQTQTMHCQQELPNKAYCVSDTVITISGSPEPITQTFELVNLDNQLWIRESETDPWEPLPEDFLEESGFAADFADQYSSGFDFMIDPVLVGERQIDGEDMFEIEAEVSVDTFTTLLDEETAEQFLSVAEDIEMNTTMWIGKEDYIIRKQEVTITMTVEGEAFNAVVHTANYGINEPVDIPDPTADE